MADLINPDWPDPVADPLGHTLAVFAEEPDDMMVLQATGNVYGKGVRTGLRLGDLRRVQQLLKAVRGGH